MEEAAKNVGYIFFQQLTRAECDIDFSNFLSIFQFPFWHDMYKENALVMH